MKLQSTFPALLAAFTAAISLPTPALAQNSAACPFTPAEIKQTLGLDVSAGAARPDMAFAGGKLLACRYNGADPSKPGLWLNQTVMDNAKDPANERSFKMMAGKLKPVPNDPDGAAWQDDQGDLTNATLHYLRNGSLVELRVTVSPRDKAFADIRAKLPKLRRLP